MFIWGYKYPHSNMHELDFDWLIRKVKALEIWREKIVDPFIENFTAWRNEVVDPFIENFTDWRNNTVDPFITDIGDRMTTAEGNISDLQTNKQDKLTAGTNIEITEQNVINNTYVLPNASATVTGGIRTYWDSANSTLYITDNGQNPTPTP